jgi:hypothetical protein
MSTSVRLRACLPLLAVLVLGLGACGSQTSDSAAPDASGSLSSSPSATGTPTGSASPSASAPAGTPDCSAVWKDGTTIPRAYRGCADAHGGYVRKDGLACSSGQTIIRFADRFYGVAGGTVHHTATALLSDRGYRAAVLRCRA